jgi:hypothetical protein
MNNMNSNTVVLSRVGLGVQQWGNYLCLVVIVFNFHDLSPIDNAQFDSLSVVSDTEEFWGYILK